MFSVLFLKSEVNIVKSAAKLYDVIQTRPMPKSLKKMWKFLGSGFRTGAADDDPSGVATYTITGARTGFNFLWVMVFVVPLMTAIQEMSAHIGALSGCGLAGNIKKHYPKWLLGVASLTLVGANVLNIGANISGMSGAVNLVLPIRIEVLAAIVSAAVIFITIRFSYRKIASILNWLALSLFAYVLTFFLISSDLKGVWLEILKNGLIPHLPLDKNSLVVLFALLGTTISPYLYFWQASEEAEETREVRHHIKICRFRSVSEKRLGQIDADTRFGMFFSNFVAFFIIALSAVTMHQAGIFNVETLRQAAEVLEPLAGQYAYMLFMIGLLSSGLLSIPVLAGSAAYVLSEVFNWPASLDKKFHQARQFYVVLSGAVLIGLAMSFVGISPVKALFYSALVNAAVSPLLIILIIHMAHNPKIVGANRVRPVVSALGYIGFLIMTVGTAFFMLTL